MTLDACTHCRLGNGINESQCPQCEREYSSVITPPVRKVIVAALRLCGVPPVRHEEWTQAFGVLVDALTEYNATKEKNDR